MRPIAPLLAASLFVSALPAAAVAQEEDAPPPASVSASAAAVPSYIVQLTAFRLEAASDPSMTAGDIVQSFEQLKKDDKLDLIETVRLSTLAGFESLAQFGKKASVTVSVTSRGRNTKMETIGTLVRVTAAPEGEKVALKLVFEASRFEGEEREDSPPDISTTTIETMLLLEPGKPTLVGGTSAGATSFLMVSIARG